MEVEIETSQKASSKRCRSPTTTKSPVKKSKAKQNSSSDQELDTLVAKINDPKVKPKPVGALNDMSQVQPSSNGGAIAKQSSTGNEITRPEGNTCEKAESTTPGRDLAFKLPTAPPPPPQPFRRASSAEADSKGIDKTANQQPPRRGSISGVSGITPTTKIPTPRGKVATPFRKDSTSGNIGRPPNLEKNTNVNKNLSKQVEKPDK